MAKETTLHSKAAATRTKAAGKKRVNAGQAARDRIKGGAYSPSKFGKVSAKTDRAVKKANKANKKAGVKGAAAGSTSGE